MITLAPDLVKRKKILNAVRRCNTQWKIRVAVSTVFFLISIAIFCSTFFLLFNHHTSTFEIFIFVCVGICFSCVPFFIGISIKTTGKYKCALPYSGYANCFLVLDDSILQYAFWQVAANEPAAYSSKRAVYNDEDKFIYTIKKSDITDLTIQGDICKITGNGVIHLPIWAEKEMNVKKESKRFAFILAFEQENAEQIINDWRK